MFTENEQMAINKKLEQLRKVKEGLLSPQELAALITKKGFLGLSRIDVLFWQNMRACQIQKRPTE